MLCKKKLHVQILTKSLSGISIVTLDFRPSCRNGQQGAAGRDDGVQEDPDQAGPGDGRGHDGVPPEDREAHRAGHHGDAAGGVDAHCGQDGWRT